MYGECNACSQNSITPLHVAAKWGRKGMVSLLLDTGATIDARTRVNTSILLIDLRAYSLGVHYFLERR